MTLRTIPFYQIGDYEQLTDRLETAHSRVMASGRYILGPEVEAFEEEFAAYNNARYCVGVGNGLDALTLTLRAWGVQPGDEVIVPSNTYIATWLAVSHCGARVVPIEPGLDDLISPATVLAAITSRTRAVIAVHLYGRRCEMEALHQVCAAHGVMLLSDAAQGAGLRNLVIGDRAAAFSFYPTKNLGCFGDGGAVVTNDRDVANKVRTLRNYGSEQKYFNSVQGYNSRLDELQAAYLRVKLPYLDEWNTRRRERVAYYSKCLADVGPTLPQWSLEHVWHLFVIRHNDRERLRVRLLERGVETLVHYPCPPHLQGAYAKQYFGHLPIAQALAEMVLSLPLWPNMDYSVIDQVCDEVGAFFRRH